MANTELKYKTLEDMPSRIIFTPEEMANGDLAAYMEKLQELTPEGVEIVASDNDPAEGWGVMVARVAETQDVKEEDGTTVKKRIPSRILVWPVPTIAALIADEQGMQFVMAACQKEMAHQIARPFRDSSTPAEEAKREAPVTIADFATRRAAESQFKVFNEMASGIITMVKGIAGAQDHPFVKRLAKPMLREVLESAAAANAMCPDLEAKGLWDKVLDAVIKHADAQELSSQVFLDWKAKRHNTTAIALGEIDLDDLSLDD